MKTLADRVWRIDLEGQPAHLAFLESAIDGHSEHAVTDDDGKRRLRSSALAAITDYVEVKQAADELVAALCEAAGLALDRRIQVTAGSIGREYTDGTADIFVFPEPAVVHLEAFPPKVIVSGSAPTEPPAQKIERLASADDHLRLAIHFLNCPMQWWVLYKAFEAARDGIGGEAVIESKGWASRAEMDRFRHTADNLLAVGDEARHAKLVHKPPKNPMTLSDGDALVRRIVKTWITSLA